MRYKYFRLNVVLRILALLVLGYSGFYILTQTHFWLVSFWLFLALVIVLISLIRYVERSRRDLTYFLLSIKQNDFSNSFPYEKTDELNFAFHEINQVMKNLRNEKASNYLYLQTVVEHVRVAVLCFDEDDKVTLSNKAAKELFQKDHISSIASLAKVSEEVARKVEQLKSGERELVKVKIGGTLLNLSVQVTTFKLQDKDYKLVSFQDIKSELEEKEIESWQRLIRVLTHEIKNSVIPISTLSEVILQVFKTEVQAKNSSQTEAEAYQDIVGGLETIEARSKGLAHFVNTYDQLTKVSKPEFSTVQLLPLVNRIENLFKPDLEAANIDFKVKVDPTLEVNADANLLDQVLINLVKNAIEAIKDQPYKSIQLSTRLEQDKVILSVRDNGPGIPDEVLDNIFVPFYTTKQSGSGIGLSLSRQIMGLHKGSIAVKSSSEGTSFELIF